MLHTPNTRQKTENPMQHCDATSAQDDAKRKEASLVMHAASAAFSKAFVRNISHAASMGGDAAEARAFAKYEHKSIRQHRRLSHSPPRSASSTGVAPSATTSSPLRLSAHTQRKRQLGEPTGAHAWPGVPERQAIKRQMAGEMPRGQVHRWVACCSATLPLDVPSAAPCCSARLALCPSCCSAVLVLGLLAALRLEASPPCPTP